MTPRQPASQGSGGSQRRKTGERVARCSVGGGQQRTTGIYERLVQLEGNQRLFKFPQEVLEEAADCMDLVHLTEHERPFPEKVLLSQLLHQALTSRNAVNSPLYQTVRQGDMLGAGGCIG